MKTIDSTYRVAFQLYPKFAIAGQNATLHFSVLDENGSNLVCVYAALVMREKEPGSIVGQVPYKFYKSSDISIPYKFHDNSEYGATLLTRITGDSKYLGTPLQAHFDIPVKERIIMSSKSFLLMVAPFTTALVGGFVFVLKKKN